MDVQCARSFLQEMLIKTGGTAAAVNGASTFLINLHAMDEREVSIVFRSAAQHFECGGNPANAFWIGKRDLPGAWVDMGDVTHVSSFIAIVQFERSMSKFNFLRYLSNWLKKQSIGEQVIDNVRRQSRIFTTRECETMGLRYESPVEIDEEVRSDFERLSELAQPKDEDESREYRQLLGKCTAWMEEQDLPDEFFEMPSDELFEAVTRYNPSSGASVPMLTDGLTLVDRSTVQICEAAHEVKADTPALTDEPDDPVDSCDELERELVAANQAVVPTNAAEQFQLQRRVHEPSGYMLYKTSAALPVLIAHPPKQRTSADELTDVLVEWFHRKHGRTEPSGFKVAILQIAECLREAADEGQLPQKDRLSLILPLLTAAYKKLFGRKAPSISTELKDEISRIVLHSKCKNCGASFVPSDQSLYGSDAKGVEVVVGKKSYNTLTFCEARCEQRWQCFRCRCGRPLQRGRLGWFDPKCSTCGTGRPILGFTEMDNLLRGLDRHQHVKQYYPRF